MNKKLPEWFGKKRIVNTCFDNTSTEIIKWEVLPVNNGQHIKVRFLKANPENRQGIVAAIYAGDGTLSVNGVTGRFFELWADECPPEFEIVCNSAEGFLSVYNIFEENSWSGKRKVSQMDFSGMILEKNGNKYKYCCNNAKLNQDFDKLIFEIELL